MRTLLPLLLVLACPLMMLVCMRGMRGHGSSQEQGTAHTDEAARLREEIAELREEITRQKAQDRLGGS